MVKRMWEMKNYQKVFLPAIMTRIIIWHDDTIFVAIAIFIISQIGFKTFACRGISKKRYQ